MPESVATSASCRTADLFEDARTCAGHWLPRVRPLPLLKNALLVSGTALNGTDLCVTEAGWARHRAACALGQQQRLETVLGPMRKAGHQRRGVEVPPPRPACLCSWCVCSTGHTARPLRTAETRLGPRVDGLDALGASLQPDASGSSRLSLPTVWSWASHIRITGALRETPLLRAP